MTNLWRKIKNLGCGESNERRGENGDFSWIEMNFWMEKRLNGMEDG